MYRRMISIRRSRIHFNCWCLRECLKSGKTLQRRFDEFKGLKVEREHKSMPVERSRRLHEVQAYVKEASIGTSAVRADTYPLPWGSDGLYWQVVNQHLFARYTSLALINVENSPTRKIDIMNSRNPIR